MIRFRDILNERQAQGETELYSVLEKMHDIAIRTWLPLLGESQESYEGYPHIKNVESHIDDGVPDDIKKRFTSAEIFLLLASVLLHDIGKLEGDEENHAKHSSKKIQKKWSFLGLPDKDFAQWCAMLACTHAWDSPLPEWENGVCQLKKNKECNLYCEKNSGSEINLKIDTAAGEVHLDWLAVLLRLGDEVDNISSRAVPQWLYDGEEQENKKHNNEDQKSEKLDKRSIVARIRRKISGITFDFVGKCIKFQLNNLDDLDEIEKKYLGEILKQAFKKIDEVLTNWRPILLEIGLNYKCSFLEVSAPQHALFGFKSICGVNYSEWNAQIEPGLEPVLEQVIEAMIRLSRGIIYSTFFPWKLLESACGTKDSMLMQLAVKRIKCIFSNGKYYKTYKDKYKDFCEIIISDRGWGVKKGVESSDIETKSTGKKNADENFNHFLPTNIEVLDELLCPEDPTGIVPKGQWKGGFYIPKMGDKNEKLLAPIIAIEGQSGEGKTTLSLQIACNLVKSGEWCCLFYSLEEEAAGIIHSINGYHWFESTSEIDPNDMDYKKKLLDLGKKILDLGKKAWYDIEPNDLKGGKFILPSLPPRTEKRDNSFNDTFEQRYEALRRGLNWLKRLESGSDKLKCFFFIDSLTAFSDDPLTRSQIHQLFSLFRYYQVPLLITLERQKHWAIKQAEVHFNYARYLSDIVIRFDSQEKDGYFKQTIEVTKTRYNRRILGKHPMKIKSPIHQTTRGFDDRCGIVVYRSIHYYLSQSRIKSKFPSQYTEARKILIPQEKLPVGLVEKNYGKGISPNDSLPGEINTDSFIVVSGPHGSHKFALAMNLLLCWKPDLSKRKLIVSLSEELEIDLENVALFEELEDEWRKYLRKLEFEEIQNKADKLWEIHYGSDKKKYITILNFRMGQIMPEEFLYILEQYLNSNGKSKEGECEFDAILFTDTAQFRTGFPGLVRESLFLPAMVDTIKNKGLFSVFVDVVEGDSQWHPELLAAADCRVLLEHRDEDIVFQVNNVRGKVYDMSRRKIFVPKNTFKLDVIKE